MSANDYVTTVVKDIRATTARVKVIELVQPEDWELPSFDAGAHIDVHIPGGFVRQYSLISDPMDAKRYVLAVMAEEQGRGGSKAFCTDVAVGMELSVSLPKNHFPLSTGAHRHIFVAGGIGVTPFLSMIKAARRLGNEFELHFCAPTPGEAPLLRELEEIAGPALFVYHSRSGGKVRLNVDELIRRLKPNDHVYCCGPDRLLNAVRAAGLLYLSPDQLHFEKFQSPGAAPRAEAIYEVKLSKQGRTIEVGNSETLLSALRRSGVSMQSSCEAGTCGDCKTRYLAGKVVHQDFKLSEAEREHYLMPCVSRASSPSLTLDL
jgi:ferredoxin-NADP reductase